MFNLLKIVSLIGGFFLITQTYALSLNVEIDPSLQKLLTQSKPEGQAISVVGSTCDPMLINCKRTKASLVVPYPMYELEYDFWLKLFKQNEYLFNQWFSVNPQGVAFISVQFIEKDGSWVNLGCDQKTFKKDDQVQITITPKTCIFDPA